MSGPDFLGSIEFATSGSFILNGLVLGCRYLDFGVSGTSASRVAPLDFFSLGNEGLHGLRHPRREHRDGIYIYLQ